MLPSSSAGGWVLVMLMMCAMLCYVVCLRLLFCVHRTGMQCSLTHTTVRVLGAVTPEQGLRML